MFPSQSIYLGGDGEPELTGFPEFGRAAPGRRVEPCAASLLEDLSRSHVSRSYASKCYEVLFSVAIS